MKTDAEAAAAYQPNEIVEAFTEIKAWDGYGGCNYCGAKSGQPCIDVNEEEMKNLVHLGREPN